MWESINSVQVYYTPKNKKILLGRLVLNSRKIVFEYDTDFIKKGLELSPIKLPLKTGVISSEDNIFGGLFGLFNDSLPDGWGRVLLDRSLRKRSIHPDSLSILDRLCFVGRCGMGALSYEPMIHGVMERRSEVLDEIAEEIKEFQEGGNDHYVEELLELGGSSCGARPKALLVIDDEYWLIKFKSAQDLDDIGAVEYAYYLMAKEAGLKIADSKLFPAKKGKGYFGTKRFDRDKTGAVHMHSISGLLHADHRMPSLDYESIMKVTRMLSPDKVECEKQFRLCVFNVLTHNRDDHAKNFSFLMDEHGKWYVSPAYDLTFSYGPGGEHSTMVMGEGKRPTLQHLLKLANIANIEEKEAREIIGEIRKVVSNWKTYAEDAGVSSSSTRLIGTAIRDVSKYFG